MKKEDLKKFVEDNPKLVNMRPAGDGIYVLKYKKSVFYDDLWNDYIEHCRGTIVDADFNIVSYPFTKIYNYGIESRAPVLADDTQVVGFRKVNGFMVAMTWYKNDVLVSTTGSTDSEFVGYAKEMMLKHMPWADWQLALSNSELQNMTFMFECVHPSDPHIVPEQSGMYILGYRENTFNSSIGHNVSVLEDLKNLFNCYRPEAIMTDILGIKEEVKKCKHEGFVFYTDTGVSSKIKSPYYLTSKWVARNPRTDKLVDTKNDIKQRLDEEYYPLVDAIRANIVEYTAMDEQARLAWVRDFVTGA